MAYNDYPVMIPGRLRSAAVNGVVADAQDIYDEVEGKSQHTINSETKGKLDGQNSKIDAKLAEIDIKYSELDNHVDEYLEEKSEEIDTRLNSQDTTIANGLADIRQATQNPTVPVAAADWPVANPVVNIIYRVSGDNSYTEYQWNGSEFVELAIVEHGVDDEPTAESENLVKSGGVALYTKRVGIIDNEINIVEPVDFNNAVLGKYISSSGYIADNQSFSYVSCNVKAGDIIEFEASGYLDYVAMIAKYYNGIYYIPSVISIDSDKHVYEFIADEDCEIYLSYDNTKERNAKITRKNVYTKEEVDNINIRKSDVDFTSIQNGKFIDRNGQISFESNWAIAIVEGSEGDIVSFKAEGYLDYVAMIAISDDGVNFNVLSVSIDSDLRTYTAVLPKTSTIYLSFQPSRTHACSISRKWLYTAEETREYVDNKVDDKMPNYMHLFNTIGIVGDSLSSGAVYPDEGNLPKDMPHWSWLENICKDVNAESHYYSKGGLSAYDFCNDAFGLKTRLLQDAPNNCYYLALGTNDKSYFQVGTVNDTAADETFAGYYKEIISTIHNHAPNAVIFCMSLYASDSLSDTFSEMVQDISGLYDYCYYVDFINNCPADLKITSSNHLFIHNWHYTGIGYIRVGEIIKDITNNIINNNKDYFKYFSYNQSEL